MLFFFFFFSSRRRHTRCLSDWSSDVCSSDLRYIEADPQELVWIGNEQTFPAKDGSYELQITEELREVLYLDEAKLAVVDHEPGTEVHSTDKLRPGKPFPRGTLLTLHNEYPLRRAEM